MGTDAQNSAIEHARERIDAAIARLQESTAYVSSKLSTAASDAQGEVEAAKSALAEKTEKFDALEAENRRLQDQITSFSEQQTAVETAGDSDYAALEAEKNERITALEGENLRLHEQVAALSLQPSTVPEGDGSGGDDSGAYAALEAEKNALQQNYDLLKRQYTSLQDEMEGMQDGADFNAAPAGDSGETDALRAQVQQLTAERNSISDELDATIAELEDFLSNNRTAAGGN